VRTGRKGNDEWYFLFSHFPTLRIFFTYPFFSGTIDRRSVPLLLGDAAMDPRVTTAPEELLRWARQGNSDALGCLLEGYRVYLRFLARQQVGRRLQGKADPSDLVQEAFLGATRDFHQFRGTTEREFLAWLRQILASLLANLVRHYRGTHKRSIRLEQQLEAELEQSSHALGGGLVDQQASPSQAAGGREQAVLLLQALENLAVEDRQLLTLRHLDGLTFPEVAERLGRTVDSIKKRWPRALACLRQALCKEMS
jgi:RNA polymerase sigma-70 factor (ECF subfamily)